MQDRRQGNGVSGWGRGLFPRDSCWLTDTLGDAACITHCHMHVPIPRISQPALLPAGAWAYTTTGIQHGKALMMANAAPPGGCRHAVTYDQNAPARACDKNAPAGKKTSHLAHTEGCKPCQAPEGTSTRTVTDTCARYLLSPPRLLYMCTA